MKLGAYFAELFSTAHESETPANLILEKEMDLFNNNIGHKAQIDFPNRTNVEIAEGIYQKLLQGELRYLSPLNAIVPPNFGINSQTQLTPTNQ